ncbi:MAG: hypothetical protein NT154_19500, partial [Verrucomicrobia bacterium]|nr:hypothetical protein [Verrucomicrobiota bacterium]
NPDNWNLDRTNPAAGAGARQYVQDIVGTYANDPRILIWDLYNEPNASGAGALLTSSVNWARELNPIQPVAPTAFSGYYDMIKDLADIINIHEYPGSANQWQIDGRPVIVSEWMFRSSGDTNPIARLLPKYHAKRIGVWQWGLVNGDTQTHFPWGSPPGAPEPNPWHHDLYRRDGTPYRQSEIDLYVQWANTPPPPPPLPPPPSGLIRNGSFEFNSGDGTVPTNWTKDFNCYGAWSGGVLSGSFGLHPGNSANTGGAYQDFATTPGETCQVNLSLQNFGSSPGDSRLRVLIGNPTTGGPGLLAVDDRGNTTTAFSSTAFNQLFATATNGTWLEVTFQFTAADPTARFGVYNAYLNADAEHSINVDDISITPQGGGAQVVSNGDFETNEGDGTEPANWVADFNSYGAFSGAAHTGSWGLHPGANANTGGRYQDLTITPGTTYHASLWVQNFGSHLGSSHLRVVVGRPVVPVVPTPIDDQGHTTTAFDPTGIFNQLFPTQPDGSWSTVTFQFTATGAITRLGLYNAYMSELSAGTMGDGNHSINVDNVSVMLAAPPTLQVASLVGNTLTLQWNSLIGKTYDLLSNTDLAANPATWPVYDCHQDISAAPSGTNTLAITVNPLTDGRRFFVVAEK